MTDTGDAQDKGAATKRSLNRQKARRSAFQVSPLRSVGARLFLYILVGALIGLGGISYFFYRVLESRARDEVQSLLRLQTTAIEGQLARAETSVIGLSAGIKSLRRLGLQDQEAYKALTLEFFRARPVLTMGLGFGQTAFGVLTGRKWFYPYFYVDQGVTGAIGERLPPPLENIRYGDMFETDNYSEQDYYKLSTGARKKIWLEPYAWSGITMTSFSEPCFDERGELIAVVMTDVNVSALTQQVSGAVTRGTGYFVIISDQGNVLAYPPDPEKAKLRSSYREIEAINAVWPRIQGDDDGLFLSGDVLWTYRRMQGTRWLMLATLPNSAVTGPVLRVAVGAALSAGFLLALVVVAFIRRLNRGLQPILDECETIVAEDTVRVRERRESKAPGGGESSSVEHESESERERERDTQMDELGILFRSFSQMARRVQDSLAELEKANEELESRVEERTAFLKQLNQDLVESQAKLEKAREAAETANHAKSEFLANMSHELRTPLNGILGYAQILRSSGRLPATQLHGVDIIHQSGSHLLTLLNDILDLSKIEARRMELQLGDLNLQPFLRSVLEVCRVRAEQKGISFVYEPGPDLPQGVVADPKRLRQILINMLGNAVKFTDAGGVTFSVRIIERRVASEGAPLAPVRLRFRVEDTGPGLTEEQVARLFIPFEQAAGAAHQEEGTGLGLSISQKIAQLMGGEIRVESRLGQGSAFWLDLDLPETALWGSSISPTQRADIEGFEGSRRAILIVDDNAVNRSLLVDMLRPLGFIVAVATNGSSGLSQARELRPDLIITDLTMPGMGGLELIKHLRAAPEIAGTKVIVSSASVFTSDQHRSVDAGADDFLAKPVDLGDLLQKLENHLQLTWIRRQPAPAQDPAPSESAPDPVDARHAPPVEELDVLLNLAKRGRVNELLERVRELSEGDVRYRGFAGSIGGLARAFKLGDLVNELGSRIARHRADH